MATREATLRLDFSKLPVRPPVKEVMEFIASKLCIAQDQVTRIHLRTTSVNVHIDVKDQNVALKIVEDHDGKHNFMCQGSEYSIPVVMDDGSVLVKLHDLPSRISDEDIKEYFSKHGKVMNIFEGKWTEGLYAGSSNGYRFVRIVVEKPIPSFVDIRNTTTLATYKGQKPTCSFPGTSTELRYHMIDQSCPNFKIFLNDIKANG
ncbi:uncharacterized protein LOC131292362 [Anopheles ziemanni]|uniref:uncharacterized protein LOC131270715 n=1 Tax=Anopheles coustani TaxID=139045 RepID=UPI00265897D9|nr:uncharacterized protein LOC131270715 [Anopheles coustani]XP_058176800.1 uncharacterized protein LOC131292362 [Anopheles ziemanni]